MTYYIYDSDGYVGDLGSTRAISELRAYLMRKGGASKQLALKGTVTDIQKLKDELATMKSPNPSLKSSLDTLLALISKCKDVVIITDGVF